MVNSISLPVRNIFSNQDGYSQIAEIVTNLIQYKFSTITLDMRQMSWCDGNMCAPLGAILYCIGRNVNDIELDEIPSSVEALLCKNGFLTNYGRARLNDTYGSTIQYQRFEPHEDRVFSYYLDEQLRNKAIPEMSKGLHKKFIEGLMEIFSNAVLHSETKLGIFVCGQYFHKQHRLDFTIADLGVGMRQNLSDKIGLKLPSDKAIEWALEGAHTTKRGRIPGGLGLKLLREFIQLNHGKLQIVSDTGYWEQFPDGQQNLSILPYKFPGTVVNIEINTADSNSYILSSEQVVDVPF
jgi:hypothetical protein